MNISALSRIKLNRLIFVITIASTISACSTTSSADDSKSSIGNTFKKLGSEIRDFSRGIKTKRSSSSKRASFSPDSFDKKAIPHTLLKKPVASGKLTSDFGYRLSPKGFRLPKKHKGVDYVAATGTPIYAAGDGEITKIYTSSSYGNYIKIKHENGFATAYAHLEGFSPDLSKGSRVTRGQVIGTVGSTGRSTAPHLHYEMLYKGKFIDPLF